MVFFRFFYCIQISGTPFADPLKKMVHAIAKGCGKVGFKAQVGQAEDVYSLGQLVFNK